MEAHLTGSAAAGLLGREHELAELDRLLEEAAGGLGGGVLFEGPAGIGKTALLKEAEKRAAAAGMKAVSARGGELERDLAFGVVRQLFERYLAALDRRALKRASAGAAAAAVQLLEPSGRVAAARRRGAVDEASLVHSVYWLCVNLAARVPVLVVVDDLHWADGPSQRWLAYLVGRLKAHPIFVVAAWRTGEVGVQEDFLDSFVAEPRLTRLRPSPLAGESVAELVRRSFGAAAEDQFCAAFHAAGGGNPFITVELTAAAIHEGVTPTAASADRVRALGPEAVARDVLRRIGRLGAASQRLARAVAILGTNVELADAANLAALSAEDAGLAADALAEARVLRPERPLEFLHPVIRSVIYEDIASGQRSHLHMCAARALLRKGKLEAAAVQLLNTDPSGNEWVVETLCSAAAAVAAPDSVATYLKRALAEPPAPVMRFELLLELGAAEEASLDLAAIDHLREAHQLCADPLARARSGRALASALSWSGRTEEAQRAYAEVIEELRASSAATAAEGRELRLLLEADLAWAEVESGRLRPGTLDGLRGLMASGLRTGTPGERNVSACLAYLGSLGRATPQEVAEFARRARSGADATDALTNARYFYAVAWALEIADHLDLAERHAAQGLAEAEKRSSPSGIAFARTALAIVSARRGAVEATIAHAQTALEIARDHGIGWLLPPAAAALADALIERGELEAGDRALKATEIAHEEVNDLSLAAFHRHNRARLRLAQGRSDAALDDFLDAGRLMRKSSHDHPAYYPWRSGAALAHLALGRRDKARPLVAEELQMARAFGAARPIGVSLRTAGLVEGREAGLQLLQEAVGVLEESPAELERARAFVELGSALRRSGKRNAGKEMLLRGLDLADRCGSLALMARAREELHTLGARPRRAALSGVESLTAGEERVARLAAEGMTNREIAQRLMVSPKTVEKQLAHVYRKLRISSRKHLRDALSAAPP